MQPARITTGILRSFAIVVALCFAARAHADDRTDARAHYQAGVKFYAGGDYQGAIREFSAAQQLVPADLNNYNLALCYDKLGDAEPAVQYYRAFLDKQPNTDKRAEIEASISRLEAASRAAANKKTPPTPAPTAAPPPPPVNPPPPPAGPVAGPPPAPGSGAAAPAPGPAAGPVMGPQPAPAPEAAPEAAPHRGPAIAGSIGTPSPGAPAPTGDAQLDRAGSINIDEIRDQRGMGGAPGPQAAPGGPQGAVAPGAGPGSEPRGAGGPAVAAAEPPSAGPNSAPPIDPNAPPGDVPKKEDPVYKKWWFWVVIGVTGVVVYELTTGTPSSSNTARQSPQSRFAAPQPGGLTLLRW